MPQVRAHFCAAVSLDADGLCADRAPIVWCRLAQAREHRAMRGDGSVVAHGPGRWRLHASVGVDPTTGRRDRRSRIVEGTRREAQAALRRWLTELESVAPGSRGVTLADAVAAHLDELEQRGRRHLTVHRYRRLAAMWLPDRIGAVAMTELRHRHIEAVLASMVAAGQSASSGRQMLSLLSGACRWAQRAEVVAANVARIARRPVGHPARHDPPTADQVRALMAAAAAISTPAAVLVRLAAASGARRGELAALRWSDIDMKAGVVSISRSLGAGPGGPVEQAPKTPRSVRSVTLDSGTVALLAAWRAELDAFAAASGVRPAGDGRVFADLRDPTGRTGWHPDTMSACWRRVRAHVPGCGSHRLHDLRHAHATMLLDAGSPAVAVAERLGHANLAMIATYGHRTSAADRAAAGVIGGLLG